ncbi:Rid family hydrolase [Kitasatospora sp. A2-31]|uniref:Rid family hydrolase n=1 Tax=Kitasatospora sp. A2-31 TaxID=2916414 RepID=UPI001EE88572|nr:Rid family hydrolase [Kitasatospora sp. A2-31]MCG6493117.1 Rid family hydrolase [Kitasatospora sp. A2-31]
MTERQVVRGRVGGISPWEEVFGSAQAVAAGDHVHVAGARPFQGRALVGEGDPYEQAVASFRVGLDALAAYGLTADDVVRTRMYLTHARDVDAVGRAHREIFETVRPVAAMVVVQGLIDPRMLVEVELDAHRPGLASTVEGGQP